jgi:glucose/arabinose dehydrogenase
LDFRKVGLGSNNLMFRTLPRRCIIGIALLLTAATTLSNAQQTFRSSSGDVTVETVASGLEHPWALAFLPDGRMLVTERPGRLRIVTRDGRLSPPVAGVPLVNAQKQSGLLDAVLDRDFTNNRTIYFCFAEPVNGGGRTALARARFVEDTVPELVDVELIFRQDGPPSTGNHYGCRIAQDGDSSLFLTMGDHEGFRHEAQSLADHIGKIVRIRPNGTVPPDNPFVGRPNVKPEIWSYGHRNSQGAMIHPQSGKLWMHEHGPRGGDELNIPLAGRNYGWPVIGYGTEYSGAKIHASTHKEGMEQPIWVGSIAPSGMAFYTGGFFLAWKGSLFMGGLSSQRLVRLELDGERVVSEEHLLTNLGERIRDVRQGPDGALWLLTDHSAGRILRLVPAPQD